MKKNLVFISLDCVRRGSLNCYPQRFPMRLFLRGRKKYSLTKKVKKYLKHQITGNPTPIISKFSKEGIRFDQAICDAPYTPASHASILTGLIPPHHGIRAMIGYKIKPKTKTLATVLKKTGYQTGAFIGAHAISSKYGHNKGFDVFDEEFKEKKKTWIIGYQRPAKEVTDRSITWLSSLKKKKPFFLFSHYFDAHDDGGNTNNIYYQMEKTQIIDQEIGRLISWLKRNNKYKNTVIVIFADHGDAFWDHGEYNHREYIYDTTIRVPLIIKPVKNFSKKVVSSQVRTIDIMPTALEMVGLKTLVNKLKLDGSSLKPYISGKKDKDLPAYMETYHEISNDNWNPKSDFTGLRTGKWKLIINKLNKEKQLYDLESDPDEISNLSNKKPEKVKALEKKLINIAGPIKRIEKRKPNMMKKADVDKVKKTLEALGYM